MVDAILLVLREVLEAALIISLLLALSRKLVVQRYWLIPALVLGLLSSWALAHYAYEIADAWDGTGQEWTNALLYLLVIVAFIALATSIAPLLFKNVGRVQYLPQASALVATRQRTLLTSCILAVGLSLAREVAEIWIYLSGFVQRPELLQSALTGGAIGLGIGISLGVIIYYLLLSFSLRIFLPALFAIMLLLCGGLGMQVTKQLMQIGVLDSSAPLWDSSDLVSEHSWLGELLYALLGYDASPSREQVVAYVLAIIPIILVVFWHGRRTGE